MAILRTGLLFNYHLGLGHTPQDFTDWVCGLLRGTGDLVSRCGMGRAQVITWPIVSGSILTAPPCPFSLGLGLS